MSILFRADSASLALLLVLLGACSTVAPTNQAITQIDESSGYRRLNRERSAALGENLVLLAFSGGGTRASALSYGVMQELRDTLIDGRDGQVRLLDEVDTISSVSGGSFTAAYYGAFREQLFEDFEDDFLRREVQGELIKQLFNPAHWWRSAFNGFDRTEMAIDYYDRNIFKGATFNDIQKLGPPFIDINATDLTTGLRFTFSQNLFDLICTDLGSYPIARAVTASSAVPVAFPSIVLENHADQCDIAGSRQWELLLREPESEAQERLVEGLKSYRDVEKRKFIHLVDGGISDNLGLRAMIDRAEGLGDHSFEQLKKFNVKNVLVVLVNAEVKPEQFIEESHEKPSVAATVASITNAQMDAFNQETLDKVRTNLAHLRERSAKDNLAVRFYFAEVSFDQIQTKEVSGFLNSMPTTLELEDVDVDRLITSGRILLRHEPSFQLFKHENNGKLVEGAMKDEVACQYFDMLNC
ncbi:MAG: patatin-like phospholipase family protein [Halioglobus sp.]